ncbi:MAG TPA: GDSL-type esterase/lipase family protein [Thermoleophilaceae bacterium]|nr:GDSL-type esterase/lipase family protein [Thermoleophilaceae bacterium]
MAEPTTLTTASDPAAAAGGPADPTGGVPHDVFAVPDPPPGRRGRARDALIVVGIAALLLVLLQGAAVRGGAEELSPGIGRDIVEAVGEPTGWIADVLPFSGPTDDALAWLESDGEPEAAPVAGGGDSTLLVTGDSLAMPLDTELARRYAGSEVAVERDAHVGTGISKSDLVDWTELSAKQARRHDPDAVVVFIGANEGFSLQAPGGRQADCCGAPWQEAFAARVRRIAEAYLTGGDARVYWLTVPKPRDPARQEIATAVNSAVVTAADEIGDRVRVIDLDETFAPGGDYTDAIEVDGRERIVREQDGIHLNAAGAAVAADLVQDAVDRDFDR